MAEDPARGRRPTVVNTLYLIAHRHSGIPAAQKLDVYGSGYPIGPYGAAGGRQGLRRQVPAIGALPHRTVRR